MSRVCEIDNGACKRQVRALCFHCSKNLCRIHLAQHTQLVEETTSTELHSFADKFNELSSRFNDLHISSNILEQPFTELEKWRLDSHEKIDQMAENKRQEINEKIEEYRSMFTTKNYEQIEKINANKRMIVELIEDTDASNKQIADLQTAIDSTEKYLNSLNTHGINTVAGLPFWFIDIQTRFFDFQLPTTVKLREFKVTYIRLDGVIRHHYVKTRNNGTMSDLIHTFVRQYHLFEVLDRIESNSITMIDHQPNSNLILPTEVCNYHIRKFYPENYQLTSISHDKTIVFYELPSSTMNKDDIEDMYFCIFQRLPKKKPFAWPIVLFLPHDGCRGQDVLDTLHSSISKYFPSIHNQHLYHIFIMFVPLDGSKRITKPLNDVLEHAIDLNKFSIQLIVDIDNEIAEMYDQNQIE